MHNSETLDNDEPDTDFGDWSPIEKFVPTWRSIGSILELRVFSRLYVWLLIVPLAARVTSELEELDFSNYLGEGAKFVVDVPFNWYLLYLGAVLGVITRLLYIYGCPPMLRQSSNAGQAIDMGITVQGIRDEVISYIRRRFSSYSNRERYFLYKLLKRLGVNGTRELQKGYGGTFKERENWANLLVNTALQVEEPGTYRNPQNPSKSIEREQLVRLVYRSSERFFEIVDLRLRACIVCLLTVAFALVFVVFVQGFLAVSCNIGKATENAGLIALAEGLCSTTENDKE